MNLQACKKLFLKTKQCLLRVELHYFNLYLCRFQESNIVYPCLLLFKEGEYKLIKPSAKGKLPRRHSPVNTWNISSMQWSTNDKVINEKLLYNLASIVVFFGTWCKYLYKSRTSFALKHFIKSGWTLWIDINFAT